MENLNYRVVVPRIKSIQAEYKSDKRKILCFRLPGNADFCMDDLAHDAWTMCVTGHMKEAEQMVRGGQVSVGLIMFDHIIDESQFESLSELLSLRGVKWVALCSDYCMSSEIIWQLIGEFFFDYHSLPIDRRWLFATLGHAYGMARLEHRCITHQLTDIIDNSIIGTSTVMQQLSHKIRRIAGLEAPALIMGESGTGKELAAHALHDLSNRRTGPFEAVNCAALPASLIQSELFGHEKGAFTGASSRKIGRFEAASSGTIFLDEIGDLPLEQQINLLRIIEQKVVRRVGGTRDVPIDVRARPGKSNKRGEISGGSFLPAQRPAAENTAITRTRWRCRIACPSFPECIFEKCAQRCARIFRTVAQGHAQLWLAG